MAKGKRLCNAMGLYNVLPLRRRSCAARTLWHCPPCCACDGNLRISSQLVVSSLPVVLAVVIAIVSCHRPVDLGALWSRRHRRRFRRCLRHCWSRCVRRRRRCGHRCHVVAVCWTAGVRRGVLGNPLCFLEPRRSPPHRGRRFAPSARSMPMRCVNPSLALRSLPLPRFRPPTHLSRKSCSSASCGGLGRYRRATLCSTSLCLDAVVLHQSSRQRGCKSVWRCDTMCERICCATRSTNLLA